jgi:hypothetical protein
MPAEDGGAVVVHHVISKGMCSMSRDPRRCEMHDLTVSAPDAASPSARTPRPDTIERARLVRATRRNTPAHSPNQPENQPTVAQVGTANLLAEGMAREARRSGPSSLGWYQCQPVRR